MQLRGEGMESVGLLVAEPELGQFLGRLAYLSGLPGLLDVRVVFQDLGRRHLSVGHGKLGLGRRWWGGLALRGSPLARAGIRSAALRLLFQRVARRPVSSRPPPGPWLARLPACGWACLPGLLGLAEPGSWVPGWVSPGDCLFSFLLLSSLFVGGFSRVSFFMELVTYPSE